MVKKKSIVSGKELKELLEQNRDILRTLKKTAPFSKGAGS